MRYVLFFVIMLTNVVAEQKCVSNDHALIIKKAWARASSGANSAVFMRIMPQKTPESMALIKAESSVAKTVELHTHIKEGDVYKMRPVDQIPLPVKKETLLKPGSLHIMLMNLHKPLKEGDVIDLELHFTNKTKCTLKVPVSLREP